MPISSSPLEESFFLEATEKVFADGIFGHINQQNRAAAIAKQVHRSRLPRSLAFLADTWKKIFPPYRDMRHVPWYAFVNHRPYLMPVAWSYRFLYCLVHKPKASTDRLADPYTHQEEIAARENLITSWGL